MNRRYESPGPSNGQPDRYPQQEWNADDYRFGHRYRPDRPTAQSGYASQGSDDDEERGVRAQSPYGREYGETPRGSRSRGADDEAPYGRDYGQARGGGGGGQPPYGRQFADPARGGARGYGGERGGDYGGYDEGSRQSGGRAQHSESWGFGEYSSEREMSGGQSRGDQLGNFRGQGAQQRRSSSLRGDEDYGGRAGMGRGGDGGGYGPSGYGAAHDYTRRRGQNFRSGGNIENASSGYGGYGQGRDDRGYDEESSRGSRASGYSSQRQGSGYGYDDRQGSASRGQYGGGAGMRSDWNESERYPQRGRDQINRYTSGGPGWGQSQPDPGFSGRGPKGYQRSDERLREDISERLTDDPEIDASEVSVDVSGGKVTLSGEVEQRWMKHHVENLVDRCSGVQDIDNRLTVSRGGSDRQNQQQTQNPGTGRYASASGVSGTATTGSTSGTSASSGSTTSTTGSGGGASGSASAASGDATRSRK